MVTNQMRITGFASGLDIDSMVRDLMIAERAPLDKLFQKKEWLNWQRDAYRDVNLQLDTFRKSHEKLRLQSSFNGFKATSLDTTVANVTAKSSAVSGTYNLSVSQLAEVANVTTTNAIKKKDSNGVYNAAKGTDKVLTTGETSEITINGQKVSITDTMTFNDVASKISGLKDSAGNSLQLRASFDNTTSRFVISTKNTGEAQKISISDTGTGTNNVNLSGFLVNGGEVALGATASTFEKSGKDSIIKFNEVEIISKTNKVSAFGVELDLLKVTPTDTTTNTPIPTKITVASDTTANFENIKKFVEDYNKLVDSLTSKVKEKRDRDYSPLTDSQRDELSESEVEKWDEKAKRGLLFNDSIIREGLSSLREKLYKPVSGLSGIDTLSKIGITTEYMATDGKLKIDETKLREAIANDPDGVMNLFTSNDGIGSRVYEEVNKQIDKLNKKAGRPNTASTVDISAMGKNLTQLNSQMVRWEDKLSSIENRYWKQFNAMEMAIQKMNEQSSAFMSNMGY